MRLRNVLSKCYIRSPVEGGKKRLMKLVRGWSVRSDGFTYGPNLEIWVGRRTVIQDETPFLSRDERRLLHNINTWSC